MINIKKIIPISFDPIFTGIFNDEKNMDIIENFLSIYFNIPIDEIKGKITIDTRNLKSRPRNEMRKQVDLILNLNKEKINIELNNSLGKGKKNRNIVYACKIHGGQLKVGDRLYSKIGKTLQINLNNFKCNKENLIERYYLKNEEGELLSEKLEIDFVDIEKAKNKEYNECEEKLAKWLRALTSMSIEELEREIDGIMNSEEKEKLIDEVEKYNEDEEVAALYSNYTREELERNTELEEAREEAIEKGLREGIEQGIEKGIEKGIEQRNIEIAKNMLKENIDINTIVRITGIEVEDLKKL